MTISEDDPRQKFEQVADILRDRITRGSIRPGQKLESVRDLADRFQISPSTIQKALGILRTDGLITTSGRGNYARDPQTTARRVDDANGSRDMQEVWRQLEHVNSQLSELRSRVEELEGPRPRRAGDDK